MEERKGISEPLPWDQPKPHPDDGDLFDVIGLEDDDARLTLAQIEAAPLFRDIGQPTPPAVESGTVPTVPPSPEPSNARRNPRGSTKRH